MRTRSEMEIEARRIEERAREWRLTLGGFENSALLIGTRQMIRVFTFPASSVRLNATSQPGTSFTHHMMRHIAAVDEPGGLEYRLIEHESISDSRHQVVRHYEPVVIDSARNAFEMMSAGFRRIDEDHLHERIEPIVRQVGEHGFTAGEWEDALCGIQEATDEFDLSSASRMRVRSDAIDLLEGRLELGDFAARTAARQNCFEFRPRLVESRQITESIKV